MPDNSLKIGACAGILAGAGTGFKMGAEQSKSRLKPFLGQDGKASLDAYVKSRLAANEQFIMDNVRRSKIPEAFKRISQKAKLDFKSNLERAASEAKKCKKESTTLLALLGLIVGLVVGKIFSTNPQNNE